MEFAAASLDKANRIAGVIVFIFILGMLSMPLWPIQVIQSMPIRWVWLVPGVVILVILLVAAGFSPRGYRLTDSELAVRRRAFGVKRYQLSSFYSIEDAEENFKPFSHKRSGAAGFFGYSGRYKNKVWGHYEAQATNAKQALVLLGPTPLVVSPAEPGMFKEIIQARLKQLERAQ
jgi:hypothetical protein